MRNRKIWSLPTCLGCILACLPALVFASNIVLYFPPAWKNNPAQAKVIADALGKDSGLSVRPHIAKSYSQILAVFLQDQPVLVYVGSFVQAVLYARGLSTHIAQAINGKEFYTSVLIAPRAAGDDPLVIVTDAGTAIAYTKAASSGESGAQAATEGKAAIGTFSHRAAVNLVKIGKAKAAFVKNWWWQANHSKYPDMQQLNYPGVTDHQHADYVLSANKAVTTPEIAKLKQAIYNNADVFAAEAFMEFNPAALKPTLDLMKKGQINPKTYSW